MELEPTRAEIISQFDQELPAITELTYGKGKVILIGFEASRNYFNAPAPEMKHHWLEVVLGDQNPGYSCQGAHVYRLASLKVDHYYLVNNDPNNKVNLTTQYIYEKCQNAISRESIEIRAFMKEDS